MTVRRDYGNFSKATQRWLPPMIAHLGYTHMGGGFFGRTREGWLEGFGLQQTQYGDGSFCINMGIHVPALAVRWLDPEKTPGGFSIGFRLSERGADQGDAWLPAADKIELLASLDTLVSWLPRVEPWFEQFMSLSDVARIYRSRTHLTALGETAWFLQLMAANYGFLLAEAGELDEARKWLAEAERLMSLPVYYRKTGGMGHEKVKGARLAKPDACEQRQLQAVRASLEGLGR